MDQPVPAQAAPQEEGSEQPQQGAAPGGAEQVIQAAGEALAKLQQMFSKAQGMDQEKELSQKLYQGFGMLVQMLSSEEGAQQGAQQPGAGVTPAETGGKPASPAL